MNKEFLKVVESLQPLLRSERPENWFHFSSLLHNAIEERAEALHALANVAEAKPAIRAIAFLGYMAFGAEWMGHSKHPLPVPTEFGLPQLLLDMARGIGQPMEKISELACEYREWQSSTPLPKSAFVRQGFLLQVSMQEFLTRYPGVELQAGLNSAYAILARQMVLYPQIVLSKLGHAICGLPRPTPRKRLQSKGKLTLH